MAERVDTKSRVKLSGFLSQLEASSVSNHTEKLWYNETVGMWMTTHTLPSQGLSTLVKELTAATT